MKQLFVAALSLNACSTAFAQLDRFAEKTCKSGESQLHYRLLSPPAQKKDRKYPLILFLHGAGERGDDNKAQLKHGMKKLASDEFQRQYPCFVMAPQCPRRSWWSAFDRTKDGMRLKDKPTDPLRMTLEVVDNLKKELPIDADRVYITGLSMGGFGTWDAIARHPNRFAAAVPICGGGDPTSVEKFKSLPIWCFHGGADRVVPARLSRAMIDALKVAGAKPKYTEYEGVGHDSWTASYNNPELYKWLFAQRRKKSD